MKAFFTEWRTTQPYGAGARCQIQRDTRVSKTSDQSQHGQKRQNFENYILFMSSTSNWWLAIDLWDCIAGKCGWIISRLVCSWTSFSVLSTFINMHQEQNSLRAPVQVPYQTFPKSSFICMFPVCVIEAYSEMEKFRVNCASFFLFLSKRIYFIKVFND